MKTRTSRPSTPKAGVKISSTTLQSLSQRPLSRRSKSFTTFQDIENEHHAQNDRSAPFHAQTDYIALRTRRKSSFIGTPLVLEEIKSPKSELAQRLQDARRLREQITKLHPAPDSTRSYSNEGVLAILHKTIEAYTFFQQTLDSPAYAIFAPESWNATELSNQVDKLAKDVRFSKNQIYDKTTTDCLSSVLQRFHRFLTSEELAHQALTPQSTSTAAEYQARPPHSRAISSQSSPLSLDHNYTLPQRAYQQASPAAANFDALRDSFVDSQNSSANSEASNPSRSSEIQANTTCTGLLDAQPVTPSIRSFQRPGLQHSHRSASYSLAPSPVVKSPSETLQTLSRIQQRSIDFRQYPLTLDFEEFEHDEDFHAAVSQSKLEHFVMAPSRTRPPIRTSQPGNSRQVSESILQLNYAHADRMAIVEAKNFIDADEFGEESEEESATRRRLQLLEQQRDVLHQRDLDLQEIQMRAAALQDHNEELLRRILENEEQRANSEAELAAAKVKQDNLAKELKEFKEEAKSRDETIESQSIELQKAEGVIAANHIKVTKKISELEEQRQYAENALAQRTEDLLRLKQQKDSLEKTLEQKKVDLAQIQQERDELVNASAQFVDHEHEKEELLAEVQILREQLEHKEQTISDMNEDYNEPSRETSTSLADELSLQFGGSSREQYSSSEFDSDPETSSAIDDGEYHLDTSPPAVTSLGTRDSTKPLEVPDRRIIPSLFTASEDQQSRHKIQERPRFDATDNLHTIKASGAFDDASYGDPNTSEVLSPGDPFTSQDSYPSSSGTGTTNAAHPRNDLAGHRSSSPIGKDNDLLRARQTAVADIQTDKRQTCSIEHESVATLSSTSIIPCTQGDVNIARTSNKISSVDVFSQKSRIAKGSDNMAHRNQHRRTGTVTPLAPSIMALDPINAGSQERDKQYKRRSTGSLASILERSSSKQAQEIIEQQLPTTKPKSSRHKRRSTGSTFISSLHLPAIDALDSRRAQASSRDRGMTTAMTEESISDFLDEVIPIGPGQVVPQSSTAPSGNGPHGPQQQYDRNLEDSASEILTSHVDPDNANFFNHSRGAIQAAVHAHPPNQGGLRPHPQLNINQTTGQPLDTSHNMFSLLSQTTPIQEIRIRFQQAKSSRWLIWLPWILLLLCLLCSGGSDDGAFGTGGYRDDNWYTRSMQSFWDTLRESLHIRPDIAT